MLLLRKVPDLAGLAPVRKLNLSRLLDPFRNRSYRYLLFVFFVWNVAIGISAVFFAPHMLTNLKMSFTQIALYSSAVSLAAVLLNRPWGILIDRFGAKPVLAICAFGIALIPLVWVFPRADFRWILVIEALYTGALWTGFNLAAFNIPINNSPRNARPTYLAMFSVVTGLGFFLASLSGGFLAEFWSGISWHVGNQIVVNYHVLFVVSALLRLVAACLFLRFHEPSEKRIPIMIQFMGYAILKRVTLGRQLVPPSIRNQMDPKGQAGLLGQLASS